VQNLTRSNKEPFWIPIALAIIVLITRLPFRSHVLFDWDSINFSLGIAEFNLAKHQPHPPGYILYILSARLLNHLTHDSNTSMIALGILASILTVVFTFIFARQIFNHPFAVASALLVATNPLLWYYDEVALTYSVEACTSVLIAYSFYMAIQGSDRHAYIGYASLGIAIGFRQTTLLVLFPLAIFTFFYLRARTRIISLVLVSAATLSWVMPLIAWSGGVASYLRELFRLSSTAEPEPVNLLFHALIYAGHIPLGLAIAYWFRSFEMNEGHHVFCEKWFLACWTIPGLLIAGLVHIGESGYILYLVPPLAIYTPALVSGAIRRLEIYRRPIETNDQSEFHQKWLVSIVALLVINLATFLLGGWKYIRTNEGYWLNAQNYPNRFNPATTLVLVQMQDFRHACTYLPQYQVYAFDTRRLDGPILLNNQYVVNGWVFTCQNHQDNYDLDPTHHQLNQTINAHGISTLLITDPTVLADVQVFLQNQDSKEDSIQVLNDRFAAVQLPVSYNQLIVQSGRLEFR